MKIFLINIILLLSINLFSQQIQLQADYYFINDTTKDSILKWIKTDVNLIVDLDNNVIFIDNNFKDYFAIKNKTDSKIVRDPNIPSLEYYSVILDCIDNEGTECIIEVHTYIEISIIQMAIFYSNMIYGYNCLVPINEKSVDIIKNIGVL